MIITIANYLDGSMLPPIRLDPSGTRANVEFNSRKDSLLIDATISIMEEIDLNAPWSENRLGFGKWIGEITRKAQEKLRGKKLSYKRILLSEDFTKDVVSWLEDFYCTPLHTSHTLPIEVEQVPHCPGCGNRLRLMWKLQYVNTKGNLICSPIWGCPSSNSTYKEKCRPAINRVWPHRCPEFITKVGDRTIFFHDWDGDGNPIPPEYRTETEWSPHAIASEYEKMGWAGYTPEMVEDTAPEDEGIYLPTKPPALMGRKSLTPEEIQTIVDTYPTREWRGFFEKHPNRRGLSKKDIQDEARKQGVAKKRVFKGERGRVTNEDTPSM